MDILLPDPSITPIPFPPNIWGVGEGELQLTNQQYSIIEAAAATVVHTFI